METYSNNSRLIKKESERAATDSPSDRRGGQTVTVDTDNLMDIQAQIQQLLAQTGGNSGALLSPALHFLQASGSAGGVPTSLSLPWNMMPQYQMMFLAGQNASGNDDGSGGGHVVVMPTDGKDGSRTVAAQQQQFVDAATLQLALQQQLAAAGDAAMAAQIAGAAVEQQQQQQTPQRVRNASQNAETPGVPKPPKKPLTPYMNFSKSIWPQVKAANAHLSSVTEIGAIIGSLWRELGSEEKLQYNEQFSKDKVRYDEELRQYLKTNGLHPSDLIKARTKKKESRTPDKRNASSASHNTSTHHQSAASRNASATSAAAAALSPTGQQLVHALVGYQDGSAGQQRGNTASAANSAALPNFSQAWAAGQPMQQILAQMGLTGQVYANADGTISVDNANLASLLALQPQLLSQAQIYTDQSGQVKQTKTEQAATSDKSWVWAGQANGGATTNGPVDDQSAATAQFPEYYTVNAQGQLIKHTNAAAPTTSATNADYAQRVSQLETELVRTQSALLEKSSENDRLKQELVEAFRLLNEYRQQQQVAVDGRSNGNGGRDSTPSTSG